MTYSEVWQNCYSGSFDLIAPDSFAHPAKMSAALCFRIIEHLEELGLLKAGATILDPMGGTGLTAICAGAKGYKAVTVELESKFIGFQQMNKHYASKRLGRRLDWTIIQGDSRYLSKLLTERGLITITSAPYESGGHHADAMRSGGGKAQGKSPQYREGYGDATGQIKGDESYLSAMAQVYQQIALVSDVCVVVTKNPTRGGKLRMLNEDTELLLRQAGFAILCHHKAMLFQEHETADLFGKKQKKVKGRMSFFKRLSWQKGSPVAQWEDVICAVKGSGNLVTITSPPYEQSDIGKVSSSIKKSSPRKMWNDGDRYGSSSGQIGNLKDKI